MASTIVERNMRYLVIEIFWAGIHTACLSFNAAFLIRLGGSNFQVSLLPAAAALMVALTTMPFAALMERVRRRRGLIVGSILAARLMYGLPILIPWLPGGRPETMVAIVVALSVAASLFSAGWLPLLGEIVPIERRARLFGMRNLVLGATVSVAALVLGRWLEWAPFPLNYQVLYGLSLASSLISTVYIARLVIPERASDASVAAEPAAAPGGPRGLPRPFANIMINTLIFSVPVWMAVPLQPIYFVRELGAGEGWLGLWSGLVSGGAIAGNLLWQRVIDRRGAGWVLVRAALLSTPYFLLIGMFPNLTLILLVSLLSGMVTPGIDVSHINVLYGVCPPSRRTTYMGMYVALMNSGAFLAPLLVGPLVGWTSARAAILLLCVVRLIGAGLFVFNPVRAEGEVAAAKLAV